MRYLHIGLVISGILAGGLGVKFFDLEPKTLVRELKPGRVMFGINRPQEIELLAQRAIYIQLTISWMASCIKSGFAPLRDSCADNGWILSHKVPAEYFGCVGYGAPQLINQFQTREFYFYLFVDNAHHQE